MKRITILLLIAVLIAGSAAAQNNRAQQRGNESKPENSQDNRERRSRAERNQERTERQRENTAVTVEGTVKMEKGFISIQSGENVYFVPMLNNYARSIKELKEGASVSVEGYGFKNMIHPTKVTIDGNAYVLLQPMRSFPQAFGSKRPGQRFDMRNFNNGRRIMPGFRN